MAEQRRRQPEVDLVGDLVAVLVVPAGFSLDPIRPARDRNIGSGWG
ncbi:MAG: hypothetical protein WBM01_21120 [Mycobacterium sp.]